MIKVNLVPAEILAKAHQKQQTVQAIAAGVVVLIIVILISSVHFFRLKRLEQSLAYNQAELKRLEVIVAKVEELERTAAAVKARLNVINDLLKGRPMFPFFMSDFARSVPLGVRVRSVTTQGGGSSAGSLKLTIAADARTNHDIAEWVRRMEASGRFTGTELGAVSVTSSGLDRLLSFTMTSTYTPQL